MARQRSCQARRHWWLPARRLHGRLCRLLVHEARHAGPIRLLWGTRLCHHPRHPRSRHRDYAWAYMGQRQAQLPEQQDTHAVRGHAELRGGGKHGRRGSRQGPPGITAARAKPGQGQKGGCRTLRHPDKPWLPVATRLEGHQSCEPPGPKGGGCPAMQAHFFCVTFLRKKGIENKPTGVHV